MERDNDRSFQAWFWNSSATFLSTLVLVGGALLGFWQWSVSRKDIQKKESEDQRTAQDKELKDRQAERERREEEQNRWLEDREAEREKRAEERFQKVVEGLSSEREEAKIGAAILLRTFLRPDYEEFYIQTFDLAIAHLRLLGIAYLTAGSVGPMPLTTLRLALIVIFKEAFPLARGENVGNPQALDAIGIQLDNAYLVGADLKQVWMSKASLREVYFNRADLSGARLRECDLRGANFHRSMLYDVDFNKADLRRANLKDADLSHANIEDALSLKDADLRGVKGLTKEQLEVCKSKGAILDKDLITTLSQTVVPAFQPTQNTTIQAQVASHPQENKQTLASDKDSSTSSTPNTEM